MSLALYILIGVLISLMHDALVHYAIRDENLYFTNTQRAIMILIWPLILLLVTIRIITKPYE